MAVRFDEETLERFRAMPARQAFDEARDAVFRSGPANSGDFLDIFEELVEKGILTWEQIESFEQ